MRSEIGSVTRALAAAAAVALVACAEPTGPGTGESASPSTDVVATALISSCGYAIAAPGVYRLADNLVACPGHGIIIKSSNVVLQLDGHSIAGQGADVSAFGIYVAGGRAGIERVRIEGPGTVTHFQTGVYFEHATLSRLAATMVRANLHGFALNGFGEVFNRLPSTKDTISKNIFEDNLAHGVTVNGGANSAFLDNVSRGNGYGYSDGDGDGEGPAVAVVQFDGFGFYLYDAEHISLRRNQVLNNGQAGIFSMPGGTHHIFVNNLVDGSKQMDIVDLNPVCASNYWHENTFATANQSCIQ